MVEYEKRNWHFVMGWLLDICNFAQNTKIKCVACGREGGVDFIGRDGESQMIIRCQGCGVESRIDAPNTISESSKAIEDQSPSFGYGVWITDHDGSNGRWMSDIGSGRDCWEGSRETADCYASERRRMYPKLHYEVRKVSE